MESSFTDEAAQIATTAMTYGIDALALTAAIGCSGRNDEPYRDLIADTDFSRSRSKNFIPSRHQLG